MGQHESWLNQFAALSGPPQLDDLSRTPTFIGVLHLPLLTSPMGPANTVGPSTGSTGYVCQTETKVYGDGQHTCGYSSR